MCRELGEIQDIVRPIPRNIQTITAKVDQQAKSILDMCKTTIEEVISQMKQDSMKIQTMEREIVTFRALKGKMVELKAMEIESKRTTDQVNDVHRFVERTVPMMIHLHICEALNITVANDMSTMLDYQRKKLEEIYRYVKSSEGKQSKINNMRRCIESHCKYFWNRDKGVSTFKYGEDFAVNMADNIVDDVDKKDEIREWELEMDTRDGAAR
jgi:hypothetical protein